MTTPIRPLSDDQLRAIIRAHPGEIAALVTGFSDGRSDARQMAEAATHFLMAHPQIIATIAATIAATATGQTVDQVAKLGLFNWVTAMAALQATVQRDNNTGLMALLYEEIAPLIGAAQGAVQ